MTDAVAWPLPIPTSQTMSRPVGGLESWRRRNGRTNSRSRLSLVMAGSLALGSPYGGTAKPKQHIYQHHVGRPAIYIIYMAFVPHIIQCSVDMCRLVLHCIIRRAYRDWGAAGSRPERTASPATRFYRVRQSQIDKKRGQLKMDTARDAMGTSFD